MTQQPRRLLFLFLVTTFLCLANSARAIAADELSAKIDQDLFLEDEGSGNGGRVDDLESSGSGNGEDDEDGVQVVDPPKKTKVNNNVDFSGGRQPGSNDNVQPINPPRENNNENTDTEDEVFGKKSEGQASFFSQPGILAAIICGAIVGLLCAILLVMFIVYRMRKKDEGSYVLDDSKRATSTYGKSSKEFYA